MLLRVFLTAAAIQGLCQDMSQSMHFVAIVLHDSTEQDH